MISLFFFFADEIMEEQKGELFEDKENENDAGDRKANDISYCLIHTKTSPSIFTVSFII